MAEYINMQQDEYDELQTKLKTLHEDIISGDETIRKKIEELVDMEGGFYIGDISLKVKALMLSLHAGAMLKLKETFSDSESAISEYVSAVIQLDVIDS